MNSLLVLGAGGHGRVVADAAADAGYDRIAFLDDRLGQSSLPFPVLGPLSELNVHVRQWRNAMVAVGDNRLRLKLFADTKAAGYLTPNVVHPRATVCGGSQLGGGVFIAAGAVVGVGALVSEAAIVNTLASVDHDCRIGAGAHVSPGARLGGGVTVGERSWIGIGASVIPGIEIASDVVVGAGGVVVSNIAVSGTYVGVPATPIRIGP